MVKPRFPGSWRSNWWRGRNQPYPNRKFYVYLKTKKQKNPTFSDLFPVSAGSNNIMYICCSHVSHISWVTFQLAWERYWNVTHVNSCILMLRPENVIIMWVVVCVCWQILYGRVNVRFTTFTTNPWDPVSTGSLYISQTTSFFIFFSFLLPIDVFCYFVF